LCGEARTAKALEDHLYRDVLTCETFKQWRVLRYPIRLAFAFLGIADIGSAVIFNGWS
jgi:hypothetical protein